jgi:hypothetical protein
MRFPDDTQRHAIVGRTGSGKTQAALWALQKRGYTVMPWIIIDYKGDPGIAKIPGLQEIGIHGKPPKHAGLYVVRPLPDIDDETVDVFMMKIWSQENTGVYLDEGYMIGRFNKAYRVLLTQGRSKHIPIITLSQSPAWISPFIFRECEFIQSFHLQTPADRQRIGEFIPGADVQQLKKYHSYYWNVLDFELTHLKPVPKLSEILNRFDDKRATRRRWLGMV